MHFWNTSYGINNARQMTMFSTYQPRRIRSKSIVTPIRHPSPSVPSTSQQHAKSHHIHHHRNRHAEFDHRAPSTATRSHQHSASESSPSSSNSVQLNSQHVPVIHSVYPRDDLPINHVVDSIESTRSSREFGYVPICIKVFCHALFLLFLLVSLHFCYSHEVNIYQLIIFILMSFIFFMITMFIVILRLKRSEFFEQRVQIENFTGTIVEPAMINQIPMPLHNDGGVEPPPPYAVAVHLPEKQYESPPPSYEKINII